MDADSIPSSECIVAVSAAIIESEAPILVMIRQAESDLELGPFGYGLAAGQLSGWVLMTGEEAPEQIAEGGAQSIVGVPLGAIIERDATLLPYLETPAPCVLERAMDGDPFDHIEGGEDL